MIRTADDGVATRYVCDSAFFPMVKGKLQVSAPE